MFQQIPLNASFISDTAVGIEHDMVLLMQSLHFTEKELKYSFINRRRHMLWTFRLFQINMKVLYFNNISLFLVSFQKLFQTITFILQTLYLTNYIITIIQMTSLTL